MNAIEKNQPKIATFCDILRCAYYDSENVKKASAFIS